MMVMSNDEIDDMEKINDVIPVNCKWRNILASLVYVNSNFVVATNNEDFKILKDIVDFYLRYKKTPP